MFAFNFPIAMCSNCQARLSVGKKYPSGLCEQCEFTSLTPDAWEELLLAAMEHWKDTAS